MNDNKDFLAKEPVGKLLLKLALPTVTAQIINMLYNIIDRIYIGHIPENGALALTGVGVCMPLIMIVSAFAALVGNGGAPRASIFMGQGDKQAAEKTLGNCFTVQLIISAVLTAVLLMWNREFLLAFGASENTVEYGVAYMNIYALGTIFVQLTLGMNAFITAQGFAKTGMLSVMIGAAANIILDPIMIFGLLGCPAMGVKGAAYATVIGQITAFLLYIVVYKRRRFAVEIHPKYLKFEQSMILQIYSVGIPSSIMMTLPSILVSILNRILGGFSDVYVAVLGVYFKLQTFIYMPANGIVQGMRPLVGYNYGAGEKERVKSIIRYSLLSAGCIMLIGTVLSLAIPGQIFALFDAEESLLKAGILALRLISLGFLVSTIGVIYSGVFESLGEGKHSLLISLLRQFIITIPCAVALSAVWGPAGVWASFPIGEVCASVAALILLKRYQGGAYAPF